MTVRSSAPPSAPLVYTILLVTAAIAALISAGLIAYITYRYVTDEELRNPIPLEERAEHSQLPAWIVQA